MAISNVLVGVTGALNVLDVPRYVGELRACGFDIQIIVTKAASAMIPVSTFGYIAASHSDAVSPGEHVRLARWADSFVVLPCSANTLGNLALGLSPNLLCTAALAYRGSLVVAPSMNVDMWSSRPVQRNVKQLEQDGHRILKPRPAFLYELASRALAPGLAMAEPSDVVSAIRDWPKGE